LVRSLRGFGGFWVVSLFEMLQSEVQWRVVGNAHVVSPHEVVEAAERGELHPETIITVKPCSFSPLSPLDPFPIFTPKGVDQGKTVKLTSPVERQ
jgi:hypothetical protein